MNHYKRKAVSDDLRTWCHFAKENDTVEVCEWVNGEGYDISVGEKIISLTMGEMEAVEAMVRMVGKEQP